MKNSYKNIRCEHCSASVMCILLKEYTSSTAVTEKLIRKNDIIIEPGEPLTALFVIQSGCMKRYTITETHEEQISGFHLPGDILGFEAINSYKHAYYVQALTDMHICKLQYNTFKELINRNPQFSHTTLNSMSAEIFRQQQFIFMLSQKNAEKRLMAFIYSFYKRYKQYGYVSLNIKLAMSRNNIANYLGLTTETISRILSRMQQRKILNVTGKYILIKNLSELVKCSEEL